MTSFLPLIAAVPPGSGEIAKPILILFVLAILSLAPFFMMMITSFVKIAVVFSLIRSALGLQQIPPNTVITGLALILSIYVMAPVGEKVYDKVQATMQAPDSESEILSTQTIDTLKTAIEAGKEPLRDFLVKNTSDKDRAIFYSLANDIRGANKENAPAPDDFLVVVPAFVVTELTEAFWMGFVIFLPFLVIDMVVSNILLAMGMFMVSPVTIALPFKLLLFVLVDGWTTITKNLIEGYAH